MICRSSDLDIVSDVAAQHALRWCAWPALASRPPPIRTCSSCSA